MVNGEIRAEKRQHPQSIDLEIDSRPKDDLTVRAVRRTSREQQIFVGPELDLVQKRPAVWLSDDRGREKAYRVTHEGEALASLFPTTEVVTDTDPLAFGVGASDMTLAV